MGGEVHDGIGTRQRGGEARWVGDVALDELEAAGQAAMAGGEVVVDDDVVAGTPQRAGRVAADVTRSAGDQDRQFALPYHFRKPGREPKQRFPANRENYSELVHPNDTPDPLIRDRCLTLTRVSDQVSYYT